MTDINHNAFSVNRFRLALHRTPDIAYNCQTVQFPTLSLTPIAQSTPVGKFFVGGKVADFGQFTFEFLLDEDLNNYMSIFEWMVGIAGATDTDRYAALTSDANKNIVAKPGHNIYSDGTLFTLNNVSNINREFNIYNMFPVSLGSPQFSLQSNDTNTCTVTFQCDYFEIAPKKT